MIELEQIHKTYMYKGLSVPVLKGVNITAAKGQALCIYGQSGSGKTTLLNIIGGMLAPTSGNVRVNDIDIVNLPSHFLAQYRREQVGFIFQQFNLLKRYTVMENLLFPLVPGGRKLGPEKERLTNLLERFGVAHRADFPVEYLSGGEQQRVAIARSLVLNPPVIIADEPFSNIDETNSRIVRNTLLELKDEGKNIVLSSFSSSGREADIADLFVHLHAE